MSNYTTITTGIFLGLVASVIIWKSQDTGVVGKVIPQPEEMEATWYPW